MAYGKEIIEYKQQIFSDIVNNDELIKALAPTDIVENDDVMYKYVFPYTYIPDTIQEANCYITFSLDVPRVSTANYFFKEVVLQFTIICHQSKMKTEYGATRTDYIAHIIEKMFNGSKKYGDSLELVSSVEGHMDRSHRTRVLRFATNDINRGAGYCS